MYQKPTQATPYSLTFRVEVILPLEVEVPSLLVTMQNDITVDECRQLRLDELDAMDEKMFIAQQNLKIYQAKMTRAYENWRESGHFSKGS
jgi:hypothetical protein